MIFHTNLLYYFHQMLTVIWGGVIFGPVFHHAGDFPTLNGEKGDGSRADNAVADGYIADSFCFVSNNLIYSPYAPSATGLSSRKTA
jgi:hypothetical protein